MGGDEAVDQIKVLTVSAVHLYDLAILHEEARTWVCWTANGDESGVCPRFDEGLAVDGPLPAYLVALR